MQKSAFTTVDQTCQELHPPPIGKIPVVNSSKKFIRAIAAVWCQIPLEEGELEEGHPYLLRQAEAEGEQMLLTAQVVPLEEITLFHLLLAAELASHNPHNPNSN